jgi:hypothetical protein
VTIGLNPAELGDRTRGLGLAHFLSVRQASSRHKGLRSQVRTSRRSAYA